MATLTDEQWEYLKQFGEKNKELLENIPEKFDLKMTRKLMQDPNAIPILFEGLRRDSKDKIKTLDELKEKLPILASSDDIKQVFRMMLFFTRFEREESMDQWNHIEALALNQIEIRKDISKLLKIVKKTKGNAKLVTSLQSKLQKQDEDMKEFRQTKPYIKFTKRYFDERQNHNEDD